MIAIGNLVWYDAPAKKRGYYPTSRRAIVVKLGQRVTIQNLEVRNGLRFAVDPHNLTVVTDAKERGLFLAGGNGRRAISEEETMNAIGMSWGPDE